MDIKNINKTPVINKKPANGITLENFFIKTKKTKTPNLLSVFPLLLIVLCALFGSILTFTTMFHVRFNQPITYTVLAIAAVVFVIVCRFPKSIPFAYPAVLIAEGVTLAVLWEDVLRGFDFIKTNLIQGINASMLWTTPAQEYIWHPEYNYYTTLLICMVAVLICMLIALFTVYKPTFIGVFLVTFPFFECGAAFGAVPNYIAFMLMLGALAAVFGMRMAASKRRKVKNGTDFIKKRKNHIFAKATQPMSGVGISIVAITVLIVLATTQFVSSNFDRSAEITALRTEIKTTLDLIMKNGFTNNNNGLADGQLATVGDRIIEGKKHLTLTMPKINQVEYLRGFAGSKYTGSEWSTFDNYQNYRNMFNNFQSTGIYPQDFNSTLLSSLAKTNRKIGSTYKKVTLSSPIMNKPYAFVLGNTNLKTSNFAYINDSSVSNPSNDYSFDAFLGDEGLDSIPRSPLFKDANFKMIWDEYKEFVHKEYLQIPDSMRSFKAIYGKRVPTKDIYEYGRWIHKELESERTYSTKAKRMPLGGDFVENFMFDTKEGYCVHFASAATMLFRAAGIPARYVEGYVIPPSKFTKDNLNKDTKEYMVGLTDANAHAWVEIFDEQKGWVKYEATPGYYNKETDKPNSGTDPDLDPDEDEIDGPTDIVLTPEELQELHGKDNPQNEFKTNEMYILAMDIVRTWSICCLVFSIIFLLGGILALRRRYSITRREQRFRSKDCKKRVRYAYNYFTKVMFFEMIQNENNTPYLKYAKQAAEHSKHLDVEQTHVAMNLFLKSRFANTTITDDEADYVIDFVNDYAKQVYKNQTKLNRWIFATVRNLY